MLTKEQIQALTHKTIVKAPEMNDAVLIQIGDTQILGQIKSLDGNYATVEINDDGYYTVVPYEIISPVTSKAVNDIVGFIPSYDVNGPEISALIDAGYETGYVDLDESVDSDKVKKAISKVKNQLISKAKQKGLWENFGQKEIRKLREDFYGTSDEGDKMIDDFDNWCMNFDLSDLNESKEYELVDNQIFEMFKTCDSVEEFLDGLVLEFNSDQEDAFQDLTEVAIYADMDEAYVIGIPDYPGNPQSFFNKDAATELYNNLKNINESRNGKIKLVVFGDDKDGLLGYIDPKTPKHVSALTARGQYLNDKSGGYDLDWLNHMYKKSGGMKLATVDDFDKFRHSFTGYDNGEYEYAGSTNESISDDDIIQLYNAGNKNVKSIAKKLDVSAKRVTDVLKSKGKHVGESLDTLTPLQTRHLKEYFILNENDTLNEFVAYANRKITQSEYWIQGGHNVESNQAFVDAMEGLMGMIESGSITEADVEPFKAIGRMNESKVYRGINKTGTVNATYNGNDDGMGTFYTDNAVMANWFAGLVDYDVNSDGYVPTGKDGVDGEVIEKDINLKNPYIINSDDEDNDSFQVYMGEIKSAGGVELYKQKLMADGHDGIILKNCNTNYYEDGTYTVYIDFNDSLSESISHMDYPNDFMQYGVNLVNKLIANGIDCKLDDASSDDFSGNGDGTITVGDSEYYYEITVKKNGDNINPTLILSRLSANNQNHPGGSGTPATTLIDQDYTDEDPHFWYQKMQKMVVDAIISDVKSAKANESETEWEIDFAPDTAQKGYDILMENGFKRKMWNKPFSSKVLFFEEEDYKKALDILQENGIEIEKHGMVDATKSNEASAVKKFNKGFVKGDTIVDETDRYIKVSNGGKIFVVGDNGERREFITKNGNVTFNPPLNKLALKGDLSILDIKNNVTESVDSGETIDLVIGYVDGKPKTMLKPTDKIPSFVQTTKKIRIPKKDWDGEKINFSNMKWYVDNYSVSSFDEAGGGDNSVALPNCNLWLNGGGTDVNGNNIVKLSFPNSRAFSLQTGDGLKETDYLIRKSTKVNKLSGSDLVKIEKEVVNYIQKFGSRVQKATLKTYKGFNEATISTASVDEIDTPQKLGFALKKFCKEKYGIELSATRYIKTVRGLERSPYQISTFRNGTVIPNELRQKAVLAAYGKTLEEKDSMGVRNWDDVQYGNIQKYSISLYGFMWKNILKEAGAVTEAADSKQMKSFLDDFKNNDVVDTNLPSCSEKDLVSLTDNDAPKSYLPEGYFKVEEFIKISPGGGWSISFQPDTIVYSDGNGVVASTNPKLILKGLEEFNPFIFKSTRPPIQGVDKLVISRYGRYPEQRRMYNEFVENVQPLSGQQAYDAIVKILSDYSPEKVGEATISIDHVDDLKSIVLYIPLKQSKDFADFEKRISDGAIVQEDIQELCAILNVPDATNGGSLDMDYDPAKLEVAYNKAKKSLPATAGAQIPQGGLSRSVWINPVITSYKGQNGYLGSNQAEFRTDQLDKEIETYFRSLGMDDDMIACFLVGKEGRWLSTALKNGADWKSFIRNTAVGFIADFDSDNKMAYQESLIRENNGLVFERSSNPLKLVTSDFSKYRALNSNQHIPHTTWSKFMDNLGFGVDDMDRLCKYAGFSTFEKMVDSGLTPKTIKDTDKYEGLLDGIKVISAAARNMSDGGLEMLIEKLCEEGSGDTLVDRRKVVELYKSGKSQAEISDEFGYDFDKVVSWTKHLGKNVGKDDDDADDRMGDDPQSKQYHDRTIKHNTIKSNESSDSFLQKIASAFKFLQATSPDKVEPFRLDVEKWEGIQFDGDDASGLAFDGLLNEYGIVLDNVSENKDNIYFDSYTQATQHVYDEISKKYTINGDDWWNKVNIGGKPKEGQTKRSNRIRLNDLVSGKEIKKCLNIQVYRMSPDKFELNYYVG